MTRRPPSSPLFPHPPLFRSHGDSRRTGPFRQTRVMGKQIFQPHASDRKSTRLNSSHTSISYSLLFFLNDPAPPELPPLPPPAALPISWRQPPHGSLSPNARNGQTDFSAPRFRSEEHTSELQSHFHLLFPLVFFK